MDMVEGIRSPGVPPAFTKLGLADLKGSTASHPEEYLPPDVDHHASL